MLAPTRFDRVSSGSPWEAVGGLLAYEPGALAILFNT
jgi:hypothetical protein